MNIIETIREVFHLFFRNLASWSAWIVALKALFAIPMTPEELVICQRHTGRENPPSRQVLEGIFEVGRKGGKSRVASVIATFASCFVDHSEALAPGERGTVMVIAADRKQARTVFRYIVAFLEGVPMLKALIVRKTAEGIDLSNGITIEVHSGSFRSVRGYTVVCCICDEIAFWRDEESANPDVEIVNAIRPAMATIPGAILVMITTLYSPNSLVGQMHRTYFGKESDDVLIWNADTRSMNPTVPQSIIDRAFEEDEAAAWSEYGRDGTLRFRSDIETFVSREVLDRCIVLDRTELPPRPGFQYSAAADPAGGGPDSFGLGIAHSESGKAVLDLVLERKGSPEAIIAEYAVVLKRYKCLSVVGDKYSAQFVVDAFARHGIRYEHSSRSRSESYREVLPALNSGRVELLDNPRLVSQFARLERRTARGGKDSIDHAPGSHDDLSNVATLALVLVSQPAIIPGFFFCPVDRFDEQRFLNGD